MLGLRPTVNKRSLQAPGGWGSLPCVSVLALRPSLGLQVSLKSTVGVKARDLKVVAEVKPGKVAG